MFLMNFFSVSMATLAMSSKVEPWYTSDLSLRYKFTAYGLQFTAMAEVNNVLDQDYEVIVNYPMPGRNFALTLTMEI